MASARLPLLLVGLALALALACGPTDARPNVLLVTIDTLRADHLGSYGFPLATSPRLDALAQQGVVFERAIAAASSTAPSHASILTSRYTREHAVGHHNGQTRLRDEPTLAEAFRDAGWATAGFVGNFVLRSAIGLGRGFALYDDELPSREANRPTPERTAEATNARALAWLARPREVPFFLWVHYQDPHGPYAPPAEWNGRFSIEPSPGEPALEVVPSISGWNSIPAYQALPNLFRPSEYRARYADEIRYTDHAIGRLLDAVDADDGGRETIVLVTADHGESLGEADRYFVHGFATTPQLAHVPMILRAPGIAPARRREAVHHVDVMPTLLELAGLPIPDEASGVALGPALRGEAPLPDRLVYCDIGAEVSAYRSDGFVRVLGAMGPGASSDPSGLYFEWKADGSWELAERGDPGVAEIHEYVARRTPLEKLPGMGAEERELLIELGYLEDHH